MEQAVDDRPGTGWRVYLEKKVLIMLALGFSSGLPILLVFGTLSFWLREAEVSRTDIGYFSWVALAYGFKWAWSPLIDRFPVPLFSKLLGRRRGWMVFSQLLIIASLCGMAISNPQADLSQLAIFAVIVAIASASQDIVIDAYRIELATERLQAALAAAYMTGYRLAMIMAGAGVLAIAALFGSDTSYDPIGWKTAYFIMAGLMSVGFITALCIHEPQSNGKAIDKLETEMRLRLQDANVPYPLARAMAWSYTSAIMPFLDFFKRYGKAGMLLLALIGCYRISDVVMGIMANAFYVDMGFSKSEVATVSKVYGVIMTLVGAGLGGLLITRYNTLRILALGAVLAALTNLLFMAFTYIGNSLPMLTLVISVDNLSAGIATAAFIAFMSGLTNVAFSATQYALFSSIMLLFPKFLAGFSGLYVDHFGYNIFFLSTALIGLPVLLLIKAVEKYAPHQN
ncbi:AmpG family muropeptide MFS transporter [Photobacterium galatheae]|uniref:MFS transporter n=1 Tax=Photobacterium galatheae TaxID=1654360 RepID=A0A066RV21_9GAMM|nr:MFS transporter [Photobacterium galatheae]KDM92971.1 MFS transporter [Photobacterium galatheae]MCM0148501.1 MFS transporter [Photobacterium galatheae]